MANYFNSRNTYGQGKLCEIDAVAARTLLGQQKDKSDAYSPRLEQAFLPAVLAGPDDEAVKVFIY